MTVVVVRWLRHAIDPKCLLATFAELALSSALFL